MIRRLLAVTALFAATVLAALAVTAPAAQALPYPPVAGTPVITASAYDPCAGASNVIGGLGFQAGETIRLVLLNSGEIGRPVANADGSFQITVTIPLAARGSNEVVATGLTSGRSARLTLDIPCVDGQNGPASGSTDGSGSLASTGAAVGGIALLGLLLVGAGTTTVMVSRRRRNAH